MGQQRRRGRVYITSLLSYIVIILLPILAYVISLRSFGGTINEQIEELNESKLTLLRESMDTRMEIIYSGMTVLAADQNELGASRSSPASLYRNHDYVSDTQSQLKRLVEQDRSIEAAFIYYHDGNIIISDTTKATASLYFNANYSTADIAFDVWQEEISSVYSRKSIFIAGIYGSGNIYTMVPLPITPISERVVATLVVKMYSDTMPRLLENLHMQDDWVYIFDDSGQLLYANRDLPPDGLSEPEFLSSTVKGSSDWRYVSYVQAPEARSRLTALWRTTIWTLASAAVLCLIATLYAMRKNYHPLNELTLLLENRLKEYRGKNEYAYLKASISSLLDSQDEAARLLTSQSEQLRAAYIEKLLFGTANLSTRLTESLNALGLPFETDRFAVIAIGFTPDGAPKNPGSSSAGNLMPDIFSGYSVNVGGKTVLLIDATGLSDEAVKKQALKLYSVMSTLSKSLVMAVSRVRTGEAGISSAYMRSASLLENAIVFGGERIVFETESSGESATPVCFSPEDERLLIDAIGSGDEGQALAVIRGAWTAIRGNTACTPSYQKLLYWDMFSAMVKAASISQVSTQPLEEVINRNLHIFVPARLQKECENAARWLCSQVIQVILLLAG